MNSFGNQLLRETLRSSRMATEDIKKLFLELATSSANHNQLNFTSDIGNYRGQTVQIANIIG
ncbi:hypothetical protein IQ276_008390 [Desmonostoc muscorum LEGE 12446]|uniref:hypothetical protein n=1 Tax=Desmonostoc muscorum TaxID=1179 RepID=UPI001D14F99A|nr:hypothetical protein [Desmonostoc muscorum]MCF2146468.1 hypothetical protein [Desmonostoc muscorum LEGE 12446]